MGQVFPSGLLERIEAAGVVAVLVVDRAEDAVPLAQALLDGGIDVMELTLRTDAALDALAEIRARVPAMIAGIGTILTTEQVEQVSRAGAAFGVAPGLNPRVVARAQDLGLAFAPGIATPSEIERALESGCRVLKFFPAEPSGGLGYLKSIAAPYAHLKLRYMPLGGIHAGNMRSYLAEKSVLALGGSWLAPREAIQRRDWAAITASAREARQAVAETRTRG